MDPDAAVASRLLDYREEHLTLCPRHPLRIDVEAFEEAASTARKEKEYLKTSKPEPVTVGGVEGQQFDVVAEGVPEDHVSHCGAGCVDATKGIPSDVYAGPLAVFYEGDKWHAIVLEDVKGETVYIDYGGPAPDFDEIAPEAQKVLDTVKWGSS